MIIIIEKVRAPFLEEGGGRKRAEGLTFHFHESDRVPPLSALFHY